MLTGANGGLCPATAPQTTISVLNQKVMLVLPWQKMTNPITSFCVQQISDKRRTASMLHFGDAFVAHTRNACADAFLATPLEWMLTIDDDMVVPFGNAEWFNRVTAQSIPEPFASFNALDRLLSHGKTLVGALYFGKYTNSPGVYNEGGVNGPEIKYARSAPVDVLKPTRWVGTGCMLIHRNVFLDIEKRFPLLARGPKGTGGQWFTTSEHSAMDHIRKVKDMLANGAMTPDKACKAYEMLVAAEADAKANSSLGMGEDVQFCTRAKACGHQPYVDFGCVCGHIGYKVYGPKS